MPWYISVFFDVGLAVDRDVTLAAVLQHRYGEAEAAADRSPTPASRSREPKTERGAAGADHPNIATKAASTG